MGIVVNKSLTTTIVNYLGIVIGYINILWIFPMALSTDEIGLLRVLLDVAILFMPFILLGSTNVSLRYFPFFDGDDNQRKQFLTYVMLVPLLGYMLFALVYIYFRDSVVSSFVEKSPLLVQYETYLFPLVLFVVMAESLEIYLRSYLKVVFPTFLKAIYVRSVTLSLVLLHFLDLLGFDQLIAGYVCIYGFQMIMLLIYLFMTIGKNFRFKSGILQHSEFRKMIGFSLFMLMGSGGGIIVAKIDTIMTTYLLGLNVAGIYAVVHSIGIVIEMPKRSVVQIVVPLVSKALKANNISEIKSLYFKSSLNLMILGQLFFIGIWLNIDDIFSLMPKKEIFEVGKYVVFFIALSKLFDMSMGINNEIIINSAYYKWNLFLMPLLAVLTVVNNWIFIPIYGITGTAIATAISVAIYNMMRFYLIWRFFKISPFRKVHLVVLSIGILVFVVVQMLNFTWHPVVNILIRSILITLIYVLPIWYFKISEEINAFIAEKIFSRISSNKKDS